MEAIGENFRKNMLNSQDNWHPDGRRIHPGVQSHTRKDDAQINCSE